MTLAYKLVSTRDDDLYNVRIIRFGKNSISEDDQILQWIDNNQVQLHVQQFRWVAYSVFNLIVTDVQFAMIKLFAEQMKLRRGEVILFNICA